MFLLVTRTVTEIIEHKLQQLLRAGIDAYVIVDHGLEKSTKRYITYPNEELEKEGFMYLHVTSKKNMGIHKVTGWDKAVYHIYKTKVNYAWICEDDVFWNRPAVMSMILKATENKTDDLIAYPLKESYETTPNWNHWHYAQELTTNKKNWSSTYNQLCRLSSKLVSKIYDTAQKNHKLVLHEAIFATLCKMYSLKKSYYNDLGLPIYMNMYWKERLTKEEIQKVLEEHSYVLIHPIKN